MLAQARLVEETMVRNGHALKVSSKITEVLNHDHVAMDKEKPRRQGTAVAQHQRGTVTDHRTASPNKWITFTGFQPKISDYESIHCIEKVIGTRLDQITYSGKQANGAGIGREYCNLKPTSGNRSNVYLLQVKGGAKTLEKDSDSST